MGFFRNLLQLILFLVLLVLIPLTLTANWARSQIYDEDAFVQTVDGLYADQAVQEAMATRIASVVEQETEGIDWKAFATEIATNPEKRAELLAKDVEIGPFVHDLVIEALKSEVMSTVWVETMREVHPLITQILKGEDTELTQTSNGVVRLNLAPIYDKVNTVLAGQGIDLSQQVNVDPDALQLTVYEGDGIVKAQRGVELLNKGRTAAILVIAVAAILLVVVTKKRSRAVIAIGIATMFGLGILLGAMSFGNKYLADSLDNETQSRAAEAMITQLVNLLWTWALIGFVVGVIFLLFGLIIGQMDANSKRSVYPR